MNKKTVSGFHAFAVALASSVVALPAFAQSSRWPSADVIAGADRYDPPKATALAAKLSQQPDMTGLWIQLAPKGSGAGPTFDPAHTFYSPPQPVEGESRFGPIPGTYLTDIPYKPEYKRLYEQYVNDAKAGKARDTFAACVPYGVPRMVGDSPVPFDIIQAPEVMIWYNDYGRTERRIFLDGREHPKGGDAEYAFSDGPSYSGHSVGHWDGNTLVVDTVDMIVANFDETSAPYSSKLHMVERLRLIDVNVMENQMTFTDPEAFERPWIVTRYYWRDNGSSNADSKDEIVHSYLNLNDRPCIPNVRLDENGFQVILLPQEIEAEAAKAGRTPAGAAQPLPQVPAPR
jgi:hypothetical protein